MLLYMENRLRHASGPVHNLNSVTQIVTPLGLDPIVLSPVWYQFSHEPLTIFVIQLSGLDTRAEIHQGLQVLICSSSMKISASVKKCWSNS